MVRLFNTLRRRFDDLTPAPPAHLGLYTCGPTVYAPQHLGNMRSYLFADVLKRVLLLNGYEVKHVMNITDVGHLTSNEDTGDDKMEVSAKQQRKSAAAIATDITARFLSDLRRLNVLPADALPTATATIDWQIDLVRTLESKGYVYRASDGLYFDTAKWPHYGELSGQPASEKRAGARVDVNAEKRHPADFALWKFSAPADHRQMEWPSPWGTGFPGWHLECSAMSIHELGPQFDLHTGGIDHIAVHHENEIAQSEAATGRRPFVRYWLHGEHLVLPGRRMGKSEGNAITLEDVVQRGLHPLAFRFLVLQSHYRSPLTFSWESLEAADQGLRNLWATIDANEAAPLVGCAEFEERFRASVNDDLNTPRALAIVQELLRSDYPWTAKHRSLQLFDQVLALNLSPTAHRTPLRELDADIGRDVEALIREREDARRVKDWRRSDELRQRINALLEPYGRSLEDTPIGPQLRTR